MTYDERMELFECTVPKFLKDDIEAWKKGVAEKSTLLDCLWGELYGSIDSARADKVITEEESDYLFQKYLGLASGQRL